MTPGLGHPNDEHPFPSADDAAGQSDWDEDDEDDEPFVEPFSLLENVVRERFKTPARTEPYAVVETIRYRHGEIIDLSQADAGKTVKTFPDGFKLVEVTGDGTARLRFRPDFSGSVVRGGKARPLKRLVRPELLISQRKKIYAVDLREGDYAQIVRDEGGYLVRFVRPPQVPHAKFTFGSWGLDLPKLQIFAGSAAFHFLILVMLGFVAPEADLYMEPEAERFAKVTMKDLKLEKPLEEPPEPEKPPEPPPEADKPTEKPKTRKRTKSPATPQQRAKVQKKQVSKVLTALQNIKPAGAPGRSNLKSLVTNIKAVRAPTGTGSSFKVSGVIGKLPGNAVRLAGGGRGGAQTKVGSQLLAGGKIGNIAAAAGTGTRVRGRARKAPTRKIRATGGVLSREAIQRVVSRHMAKIQACYERQLLVKRNLAGKIVFDWVISLNGSVGSARQVSSSLGSVAVSTCILREMRTWRFPHPVGGSVDVRYPFVFRVQGF